MVAPSPPPAPATPPPQPATPRTAAPHRQRPPPLRPPLCPEQRLDPESIHRREELLSPRIPEYEGEHPAQSLHDRRAELLVAVDKNLRVCASRKGMAAGNQIVAKLSVVVDLAVEGHDH